MNKWIATRSKAPEQGVPVLCWWKWAEKPEGVQGVAVYQSGMWSDPDNDENDYREPEFWTRLPLPPVSEPAPAVALAEKHSAVSESALIAARKARDDAGVELDDARDTWYHAQRRYEDAQGKEPVR